MSFKVKKKRAQSQRGMNAEQLLRLAGVILIAALLIVGGLGIGQNQLNNAAGTNTAPTPGNGSPTPFQFPTLPPGGTQLVADSTYFHSTGLFSIPHFQTFDQAGDSDERVDPAGTSKIARAGVTFISGPALSVLHVFIEQNGDQPVKQVSDLAAYYDKKNLDQAWANFTGGYKELARRTNGDRYEIDVELYLNGNTYLGRQVSQVQDTWLKVTRLVVPNNNLALLDLLEEKTWAGFVLYKDLLTQPVSWLSIADPVLGYVIRYPGTWQRVSGVPGTPMVASGTLGASIATTLSTRAEPGKSAKTDPEARAWVMALRPKATIYSVVPETHSTGTGFSVSYSDPDPDGNSRSALVILLNGANGTLYSANFLLNTRGIDLLGTTNVPPEIAQIRNTFTLLSTQNFVPTMTPTATLTPLPTLAASPVTPAAATVTSTPNS